MSSQEPSDESTWARTGGFSQPQKRVNALTTSLQRPVPKKPVTDGNVTVSTPFAAINELKRLNQEATEGTEKTFLKQAYMFPDIKESKKSDSPMKIDEGSKEMYMGPVQGFGRSTHGSVQVNVKKFQKTQSGLGEQASEMTADDIAGAQTVREAGGTYYSNFVNQEFGMHYTGASADSMMS